LVKGHEEVNGLRRQDTLALAWASAFTNQGLPLTALICIWQEYIKGLFVLRIGYRDGL